ncbi:MAG TPA: extracellular solute-binding protein, partial [Acidimicrobiales bacterium]|nr:extracellular solute-binding protein [Acidimicrobiales bacterium]
AAARLGAAALSAVLVVTGSVAPAWASAHSRTAQGATAGTGFPTGPVTLTLATEDTSTLTPALIKGFEALHPNVKIVQQTTSYTTYLPKINLELASSTPPDLSEVVTLETPVRDHLLLDLDSYAAQYGWTKSISPYALNEYRMGSDLVAGSGPLYAVSSGFDLTGLFYNKTLMQKLDISGPPQTLADLNADLAKAKAAGDVGLELAAEDGHGAFLVQQVADDYVQPAPVNNWIFGVKGSNINIPAVLTGANQLATWAKDGYLNSDADADALTQAVSEFNAGKALFINDGNWDSYEYQGGLKSAVGFAAFPAAQAGGRYTAMVGGTAGYAISAKTKYPQVAAAFLNYSVSAAAAKAVFAIGNLPNNPTAITAAPGSLNANYVQAWGEVVKSDGLYGYFANAFPTANTAWTQQTEELIGGKTTAQAALSTVQAGWAQSHG